VSETPIEGPGAIARWVALLDRAEVLQHEHDVDHPHPTLQRQIARAIDSLFLYEHQMLPGARRDAREYLWQRDRGEPLPPPEVLPAARTGPPPAPAPLPSRRTRRARLAQRRLLAPVAQAS